MESGEWSIQIRRCDRPARTPGDFTPALLQSTAWLLFQDFQVTDSNFILYQEGRTRRYETDIALIRLPSRAELNRGTQLACLPLPGEAQQVGLPSWSGPEVGRSATVVGLGYSCYVQQTREFCKESDEVATKTQQHLEVWVNLPIINEFIHFPFFCFHFLFYIHPCLRFLYWTTQTVDKGCATM